LNRRIWTSPSITGKLRRSGDLLRDSRRRLGRAKITFVYTMNRSTRKVNLAGREIGCSAHACAFFHTEEQFYKVLLPFIREGFAAGDRAVHIVDPTKRERHVHTLSAAGIDAEGSLDRRQLEAFR
jgi:hypothetical protein